MISLEDSKADIVGANRSYVSCLPCVLKYLNISVSLFYFRNKGKIRDPHTSRLNTMRRYYGQDRPQKFPSAAYKMLPARLLHRSWPY